MILTELVANWTIMCRRTTSKVARIKETLETIEVPDLTVEEIQAIDKAGSKLHKRVYMGHVFND